MESSQPSVLHFRFYSPKVQIQRKMLKEKKPQYGFYIKFVNQLNKQINWGQPLMQCKIKQNLLYEIEIVMQCVMVFQPSI